jgi:hypothetical protein
MTGGLVVNPQVEFPLSTGFGFSVGLYANFTPIASTYSITASMIFGKVRHRRDMY